MGDEWKETMTAQKLGLREEEKKPKPLRQALGAYQEARKESQEAKRRHMEEAILMGEDQAEVQRRQQGALEREVRARHAAEELAKAPVQAQQPVHEENDEMDEDEQESETSAAGDRITPTEVVNEVVVPIDVPKPVEARQKPRVEVATTGTLQRGGGDATATTMWQ